MASRMNGPIRTVVLPLPTYVKTNGFYGIIINLIFYVVNIYSIVFNVFGTIANFLLLRSDAPWIPKKLLKISKIYAEKREQTQPPLARRVGLART